MARYSAVVPIISLFLLAGTAPNVSAWGTGYQDSMLDGSPRMGRDSLGLDLGASGALLSSYSGYGWNQGGLYLGGEATYGLSTMGSELRLGDFRSDYDSRETWGLSGVMGGQVSRDTLLYGRAGYQQRRHDLSLPGFRDQDWLDGLRLGAGAEFRLWDHTTLRLEYSRIWYGEDPTAREADAPPYRATESWFEAGGILRF